MTDRTALVIEDDDDIRRLLEIVLQQSGFLVLTASTGTEGLETAQATTADLVTVDAGLPDIDGVDVVRRLRASHSGAIVMISARSAAADQARGIDAGADAYLTKPFRPSELKKSLEEVLAR